MWYISVPRAAAGHVDTHNNCRLSAGRFAAAEYLTRNWNTCILTWDRERKQTIKLCGDGRHPSSPGLDLRKESSGQALFIRCAFKFENGLIVAGTLVACYRVADDQSVGLLPLADLQALVRET